MNKQTLLLTLLCVGVYNFIYSTSIFANNPTDAHDISNLDAAEFALIDSSIVISEIMYNSPSSADLEFIELYNSNTQPINLSGWSFTDGIEYAFGTLVIQPGEFFILTNDRQRFIQTYNQEATAWTSGSLNNDGELIVLSDADGNEIDRVEYSNFNGWTTTADGEGASLVLCDVYAENNSANNWQRSLLETDVIEEGKEIFASPGSLDPCTSLPIVTFQFAELNILEDVGILNINLLIDNAADVDIEVDVALDGTSTASVDRDFIFSTTTVKFPSNSPNMRSFSLPILDDDIFNEPDETLILSLAINSPNVIFGTTRLVINIADDDVQLSQNLILTGVFDGPLSEGTPKGVELYVVEDIENLSRFGLGSANNGNGSDGVEYNFPAVAVAGDTYIYVTNSAASFSDYFGFFDENVFVETSGNASVNVNGNDAIELFENRIQIDVFGEKDVDGMDQAWEYTNGWAYRRNGTGPDGQAFELSHWILSGKNALDDTDTNVSAASPFPFGTYLLIDPLAVVANDDRITTAFNTGIEIDVLNNDRLPAEVISMTIVEESPLGTASVNNNLIFFQPTLNECGISSFTYEICTTNSCDQAKVTVVVNCPPTYPNVGIRQVTGELENGVADSLGKNYQLQGIVYGNDLLGGAGVSFTLIDETGGIAVFDEELSYYEPSEGDEIIVRGFIDQYNGLTQIRPDTIILLSQNNELAAPINVVGLSEATESKLITIFNLTIVNPSQWTNEQSGFNVQVTDGALVYTVRIDNNTDIFGRDVPQFPFHLTGIGSQFDETEPYRSDYQIVPRYFSDFNLVTSQQEVYEAFSVHVFPNPANDNLTIQSPQQLESLEIYDVFGQNVWSKRQIISTENINVQDWANGLYWIRFTTRTAQWSKAFVKQ